MKLRDFFSTPNTGAEVTGSISSEESSVGTEAAKYKLLQQIRSLMPGQTIQGKIVGRENGQVQIQIASDVTLSARLDSEIPIENGKMMTFQVKNNGRNLTLSPLFANMATDENVVKALDMAGIPVSERTIAMTEGMMKEGMSIDRQSLQAMFKQISTFPKAPAETIVQLQKLSIPLTLENLEQAENYKSFNHQIEKGLQALTQELAQTVESGYAQGNIAETNRLLQAVIQAVFGSEEVEMSEGEAGEKTVVKEQGNLPEENPTGNRILPEEEQVSESGGKNKVQNLLENLKQLSTEGEAAGKAHRQIGKELVSLLGKELQEQFRLEPEQVREGRPVRELYDKIQRQLFHLNEAVAQTAGKETALFKGVNQMQNNLDFMNQLNQVFHFVQLPLKLNERNAHGDLYVYTNKKNLAQKEGSVSAFLHLDMEHLGSVDIYVTMEEQRVGTRFQLQNEEMLDFLQLHMHILDERLQKRGYALSYDMQVKEDKEPEGVLDTLMHQEGTVNLLSQHAFDVRA